MLTRFTVLAALCLPLPAAAACFGEAGTTLFSCTMKGGASQVTVCLQGEVAYYAFGPTDGAPDVLLARQVRAIDMTPWPGIGRTIWEEAVFFNGAYGYRLAYAIDKMTETEPVEGSLFVTRDGAEIADLTCDRGQVAAHDFYPLYEAKVAAGQCHETGEGWSDTCD